MDNQEHHSIELLAWRVAQLEIIEKAMQLELYELRKEMPEIFHQALVDYYTKPEARNVFVSRAELAEQTKIRREWPLVVFAGAAVLCQIVTLIVLLARFH